MISKGRTFGKDLLVFIKSTKNYQLNSIPLDVIKKTRSSREIDNTKPLKINTQPNRRGLMVHKDN